jgi:uncharacterized phage protein (TIGR01671 family)
MREIKFRSWAESTGFTEHTLSPGREVYIDPDTVSIQQYTGLKDKNGKEIYESDLIQDIDSGYIGQVVWDSDGVCFTTMFSEPDGRQTQWGFIPLGGEDNYCVVLGNIYETPELLQ